MVAAAIAGTLGLPCGAYGQSTGERAASVSGYSGSLATEVPIAVPEYYGLTPSIRLTYSSSGPNGWVGVGWNLSGISTIQRSSPRGGAPRYNQSDSFFLDGQELIESAILGGTHCTLIQNYQRIEKLGSGAAATWRVTSTNGVTAHYEPLFIARPNGVDEAYRWYVTRVTDPNGREVTYEYDVDTGETQSVYLQKISYNQTEITFNSFTRALSDTVTFGTGEGARRMYRRLESIVVKTLNDVVRAYRLDYDESPSTGRGRLERVTQYGTDATLQGGIHPNGGTSLPPMEFTYADGEAFMTELPPMPWNFPNGNFGYNAQLEGRLRTGDFNGDGTADLLFGPTNGGNWYVAPGGGSNYELWRQGAYGSGDPWWNIGEHPERRQAFVRIADVNADGMSDVVIGPNGTGQWAVLSSSGTNFTDQRVRNAPTSYGIWNNPALAPGAMRFADYDGDGDDDILLGPDSQGLIRAMESISTGFVDQGVVGRDPDHNNLPSSWANADTRGARIKLVDMTADGLPDLLFGPTPTGDIFVGVNYGAGFLLPESWYSTEVPSGSPATDWSDNATAAARVRPADMNGDGLTDMIFGPTSNGEMHVLENTGTKFVLATNWLPGSIHIDPWKTNEAAAAEMHIFDVNEDGRPEIVCGPNSAGEVRVFKNYGLGLTHNGVWISNAFSNLNMTAPPQPFQPPPTFRENLEARLHLGDFTGDGITDFMFAPDYNGTAAVIRTGGDGNPVDILQEIDNGAGGHTIVQFSRLSGAERGVMPIGVVFPLVDTVTTDDGRGNVASTSYSYSAGLWNFELQRFLGFRTVTSVLDTDGTESVTEYIQNPYTPNLAQSEAIRDEYGFVFKKTVWNYDEPSALQPPPYRSPLNWVTVSEGEPGTALTSTTRREFMHDDYGNVVQSTDLGDVAVDGDETVQVYDFNHNHHDFLMGFPARVATYQGVPTGPVDPDQEVFYRYDGAANDSVPPTKGNATLIRRWDDRNNQYVQARFLYDPIGNLIVEYDEEDNFTITRREAVFNQLPQSVTNQEGHLWFTEWHPVHQKVEKITDPNGFVIEFEFDPLGRVIVESRSNGYLETTEYLDFGDPNLQRTRVTRYPDGAGQVSTIGWEERYTDGIGRSYKQAHRGLDTTSANATVVSLTEFYGLSELPLRKSLPFFVGNAVSAQWTEFSYDMKGRLRTVENPDGSSAQTDYALDDRSLLVVTRTDEEGRTGKTVQTASGRLLEVIEIDGQQEYMTRYGYDALGRLTAVLDAQGNLTRSFWDSLDRKTMMVDPDLGLMIFEHDKRGFVTSARDAKNQIITAEYDGIGRLLFRECNGQRLETYSYDLPGSGAGVGRLSGVDYPAGSVSYVYDIAGNRIRETYEVGQISRTFERSHDKLGRVRTVEYPDGEVDTWTYDNAGNLKSTAAALTSLGWTADRRLSLASYRDGSSEEFTYDPQRRWLDSARFRNDSNQLIYGADYEYYLDGKLREMDATSPITEHATYHYDGLGRLESVTGTFPEAFTYDAIGNVKSNPYAKVMTYGSGAGPHAVTEVQTRDGETIRYAYDPNGNLTTRGSDSFLWDCENRLLRSTDSGIVTNYEYDHDGNRVKESVGARAVLYFGDLLEIQTLNGLPVTETKHYFAGSRKVASRDVGATSDTTKMIHADRLNSVRAVTVDGDSIQQLRYSAFGEAIKISGGLPVEHGLGMHRHDAQTGLVYMRARYYDPVIGRFLSPDSMIPDPMNPQSLNRYSYVLNNPIGYTDPTGHVPVAAAVITASLVSAASVPIGIITLAWAGVAATTIGYLTQDPALMSFGQILTGIAGGIAGVGIAAKWGGGANGGLAGASYAFLQSEASFLSKNAKTIVSWAFTSSGYLDVVKEEAKKEKVKYLLDRYINRKYQELALKLGVDQADKLLGFKKGTLGKGLATASLFFKGVGFKDEDHFGYKVNPSSLTVGLFFASAGKSYESKNGLGKKKKSSGSSSAGLIPGNGTFSATSVRGFGGATGLGGGFFFSSNDLTSGFSGFSPLNWAHAVNSWLHGSTSADARLDHVSIHGLAN